MGGCTAASARDEVRSDGSADAASNLGVLPQQQGDFAETRALFEEVRGQGNTSRFSDGKRFDVLIEQLRKGAVDPMRDKFLQLEGVKIDNKYYSLNNRRLYCLRQYQASLDAQHVLGQPPRVWVRLNVPQVIDPKVMGRASEPGGG